MSRPGEGFRRVYVTMPKDGWGEGPWQHEPDKAQWRDEVTGLDCLAVRNPVGAWCGYVGVPEGHPAHGSHWDALELAEHPHGGLTFADGCADPPEGMSAEEAEATLICHVPEPGEPDHVWWLGFDCAHGGDVMPAMAARLPESAGFLGRGTYKTLAYVRAECQRLARSLKALGEETS